MRKKEERFVVTFATTTGAMAMERACQAAGLPGRLIPVPRSITARLPGCAGLRRRRPGRIWRPW